MSVKKEYTKKKLNYIKPKIIVKKINIEFLQKFMEDYFDCVNPYVECGNNGDLYALRSHTFYSDLRLKKNIKPLTNVLMKLHKIRGVTFEWKKATKSHKSREIGIIAQEVQQVFPEIVIKSERDKRYLTVDYSKIGPILIEAIKELENENSKLKKRIEALEKNFLNLIKNNCIIYSY